MKNTKHIIFGWIVVIFLMANPYNNTFAHTYAPNSILNSGHWVKIRVGESGICRLTYDDLENMGLKPTQVRVYGYGGAMLTQDFTKRKIDDLPAVGFWMEKGSDGVFGSGDYILFYVQGSTSWKYNGYRFAHTRNPYSDHGYYFLSDDTGEQKILTTPVAEINANESTKVNTFTNYQIHEEDLVNLIDAINGVDGGGREFFGERFAIGIPQTFSFNTPDIVPGSDLRCRIEVAAYSSVQSVFSAQIGDEQKLTNIASVSSSDFYTKGQLGIIDMQTAAADANQQNVTLKFSNSIASSSGYLNFIELTTQNNLVLRKGYLLFRTTANYNQSTPILYTLSGANTSTQVWNVTQLDSIYRVPTTLNGTQLTFVGSNNKGIQEYVAINPKGTGWVNAANVGKIDNQNLHKLQNIDYVIITPSQFLNEAKRLAKAHEDIDHITAAVITDQQVYNEFSSGTPDASAYRWMMKMLYDRGIGAIHRPSHLLLFGDGTFDNRQLLAKGGVISTGGQAVLLTYQSANSTVETKAYATDDYFGFMEDDDHVDDRYGTMEIGVGRLPITTELEAKQVVDKLINYMHNTSYGNWKQQLLFLADDGDNGLHTETAEAGAERVRKKNPNFIVNKVYLDAYQQEVTASGESYPSAKNRVENLLNNGMLFLNYSGHGGYNAITNEGLMDLHSIKALTNPNQGLWMYATCSFAHFDSGKRCAAEEAVLNPRGGAIGVVSACRTVYATQNTLLDRNFCDTLFGHKDPFSYEMTLGQTTRIAKNMTGKGDMNKMPYILLGDPAMRLTYPTQLGVVTDSCADTVRALTINEVKGHIIEADQKSADWFNGNIQITIYDKMQQITTRDNDEKNESKRKTLTYNDYPNIIYSGEVNVKDGKFAFTYMTPKDIRYNYGNGRIVYYAYDVENAAEASGYYEKFTIGGSSPVTVMDTIGPDINLYLNNPAFAENDNKTHQNPHFYAQLYDDNGINTVGSGIGHDLLLVIDEKPQLTYVLNNYYKGTNGDYKSGEVSYKMPELESGSHTLTFRAWDLLNNSSTKSLNFTVVKDMDLNVFSITTYPNPVSRTGTVKIKVEYDRPDDLVQTDLYIYNMSGQMIWHHTQSDAKVIEWNVADLGVTTGIYTYKLLLQTSTTSAVSQAGKIIVTN